MFLLLCSSTTAYIWIECSFSGRIHTNWNNFSTRSSTESLSTELSTIHCRFGRNLFLPAIYFESSSYWTVVLLIRIWVNCCCVTWILEKFTFDDCFAIPWKMLRVTTFLTETVFAENTLPFVKRFCTKGSAHIQRMIWEWCQLCFLHFLLLVLFSDCGQKVILQILQNI